MKNLRSKIENLKSGKNVKWVYNGYEFTISKNAENFELDCHISEGWALIVIPTLEEVLNIFDNPELLNDLKWSVLG